MATKRRIPSGSGAEQTERDEANATLSRSSGWLALSFVVVLLFSEAALSLPDATATEAEVAAFYSDHRGAVVILQLIGFGAALLLGLFARRLRTVDRLVSATGIAVAVASVVSGGVILAMALVADPASPSAVGTLNSWEPRADDLLFVAIVGFGAAVAVRFWREHRFLAAIGGATALTCLLRLTMEAIGAALGPVEWLAPVMFVVLVAMMGVMTLTGRLQGLGRAGGVDAAPAV